jgi:hypothetical protein
MDLFEDDEQRHTAAATYLPTALRCVRSSKKRPSDTNVAADTMAALRGTRISWF